MSRVKGGPATKKRRSKVLALAKGFRGSRSKNYRAAHESVMRALAYAYRDRRARKRDFRKLWIARISAAVRSEGSGMTYNRFIDGLKKANVDLNRKILADLAVCEPAVFEQVMDEARKAS